MNWTVTHSDCIEVVPGLGLFHAVVTDPPYHLTQVSRGGSPRANAEAEKLKGAGR